MTNLNEIGPMRLATPVWGPWASLGFTLLVWVAFNAFAIGLAWVFIDHGWISADIHPEGLQHNGLFLASSTILNALLCSSLVIGLIRLRRGSRLGAYLALRPVSFRGIALWFGLLLLFVVTSESVGYWLQRPVVPDFVISAYSSAVVPVLLWLALVVVAPLFEELLFRGFLQTGLESAALHAGWAIVLPALLWAAIHWQYDLYDMSWVFVFGVLLGLARWHTGSLIMPLLMHMGVNLAAMIATAWLLA